MRARPWARMTPCETERLSSRLIVAPKPSPRGYHRDWVVSVMAMHVVPMRTAGTTGKSSPLLSRSRPAPSSGMDAEHTRVAITRSTERAIGGGPMRWPGGLRGHERVLDLCELVSLPITEHRR